VAFLRVVLYIVTKAFSVGINYYAIFNTFINRCSIYINYYAILDTFTKRFTIIINFNITCVRPRRWR